MPERTVPKSPSIVDWLKGKTPAELNALRRGRHNYYPDAIVFVEKDGTLRDEPVLIRIPTPDDKLDAQVDAIKLVAKKAKNTFKVETAEDAIKFIGAGRFEVLDSCAIVARCMHDPAMPEDEGTSVLPPWKKLDLLLTDHTEQAILAVYQHLDLLAKTLTPQFEELTEGQCWMAAEAIAARENAFPLAAMLAGTQLAFLIWACQQAVRAREASSST